MGQPLVKAAEAICESVSLIRLPHTVPQTVEDAISVVNGFKQRHLWVYQYCIANLEHKEKEIRTVDVIYNNAIATIVAVEEDYHAGLCEVSTTRQCQLDVLRTLASGLYLPHLSQYVAK
jgi:Heterokaryon incompatibility protein (HET)